MKFFIQNKTIFRELLTVLPAGAATTGPPVGPLLGQFGVNTPSFCKQFNDATSTFSNSAKGKLILLSVRIIIYDDKSLAFVINKPQTSFLIKLLRKKLGNSGCYVLSVDNLIKIVQFKFSLAPDSVLLPKYLRIVLGTVFSMRTTIAL